MAVRVQLPLRVQNLMRDHQVFFEGLIMFYVYILRSIATDRYYIGYSESPDLRLLGHNSRKVKSTRLFRPWEKVYQEIYDTELQAIRREREIKNKKSRAYIQWLIGQTRPDENRDGK
jgi:putative endonuclease